jgi:pimeloyl-ACP methyl ester carboxylesterase
MGPMSTIERKGVEIYYEQHGRGPAVLLTHGYSATSQMWRGQCESLSDAYRLIAWDLRGHGRSASPQAIEAYAESEAMEDMVAILDACGVERAVVGGLSLGGFLSLAFHLAHPERVRALLLFDTGPGYRSDEGREGWNRMALERAADLERRGLAALGQGAEVRIAQHRSAEGLARAARGTLRQYDARVIEHLPAIDVPALVLAGEKDTPFLAATDYMARKIPAARKVILLGAGHAANIDRPDAFNAAVRAFLESLPDS